MCAAKRHDLNSLAKPALHFFTFHYNLLPASHPTVVFFNTQKRLPSEGESFLCVQMFRRAAAASDHLYSCPSPPISCVISSMRSSGKGGSHSGFMAMDISFMGLSSAATRLELSAPQCLQR